VIEFRKIILIAFIVGSVCPVNIGAQDKQGIESVITAHKMRPPLHPKYRNSENYTLNDELANTIYKALEYLWLDNILVGINLDPMLENYDSTMVREMLSDIKGVDDFSELIVVNTTSITQQGIPLKIHT